MKRVLGIDPASESGFAVLYDQQHLIGGSWEIGEPGWTKCPESASLAGQKLGRRIRSLCMDLGGKPDVIACENPTSQSRGIAKAYGMLLADVAIAGRSLGIPVVFVLPTVWKKRVLGKGGASKHAVWNYASGLADPLVDQNHADAICIAMYIE